MAGRPPRTPGRRAALALVPVLASLALTLGEAPATAAVPRLTLPAILSLPAPVTAPTAARYVPGELLVRFRRDTPLALRRDIARAQGATLRRRIRVLRVDVLQVPAGLEAPVARALRLLPVVEHVERNPVRRLAHAPCAGNPECLVPDDPAFPYQWALQNDTTTRQPPQSTPAAGADIAAPLAWRLTQGSARIRIAVLDTGIDAGHPDLAAKVVASVPPLSGTPADDAVGHGTAVAGIAAATPANGVGITGAGYRSSIVNIRVTGDGGAESFGCDASANAIVEAVRQGAQVINASYESPDPCQAELDAVEYAWARDALVVAAAGNEGVRSPRYPAAFPDVLSVGATDNADRRAPFSNSGASWVELAAPGVAVVTTLPRYANAVGEPGYDYVDGTSFAAPHVSGVAALIWPLVGDANGNGRTNDDVALRLKRTADRVAGTGEDWRHGRLNACRAAAANPAACGSGAGVPVPLAPGAPVSRPALTQSAARVQLVAHVRRRSPGSTRIRTRGCRRTEPQRVTCLVEYRRGGRLHRVRLSVLRRAGGYGVRPG